MNLTELWSGSDFAWYQNKGRNDHYRSNASRVRIVRVFKEFASSENKKMTGYAEVLMVDDETGEPKVHSNGNHITRQIRARDIAMRWDEYAELRAHREADAKKQRREYEERQRQWEEARKLEREKRENEIRIQREKEQAKKNKLTELLRLRCGITDGQISSIDGTYVILRRQALEEAFGIAE